MWRIVFVGNHRKKPPLQSNVSKIGALTLGEPMWIKTQVKDLAGWTFHTVQFQAVEGI